MRKLLLSALFALFSLSMFAQIPGYVPANGLVGWWPFNGNASDESGNGNNGTVNGATLTSDRFGNSNSAYNFQSLISNYIVANIGLQNTLSFSGWYKAQTPDKYYPKLFYYGDGSDPGSANLIKHYAGGLYGNNSSYIPNFIGKFFASSSIPGLVEHSMATSNNIWHHFAVIFDYQNSLSLYIDGQMIQSVPYSGIISFTTGLLYLGRDPIDFSGAIPGAGRYHGDLDDFGVWNRALTACEIKTLFNSAPWLAINDISICPNDTGTLITQTVENGGAFQWSSGQQTSSINVSIPTTTTYSVAYTLNGLTCTDSAIVTVIPNQTAFFPSVNPICAGDPLSPLPTSSLNLFQGNWSPPLNNLLTTTYTFTPSPNVCVWDTTTLTIVVKPLPILSSQDISACKGQQVTVVSVPDLPNGVFAWSNNSTASQLNITADTSTFYTVSYTLDGCTSLVDTISVLVNTLPFVSITPNGPTTFCAESSINLSSLSTTGNLWSNGQNAQNITVSASGTYQLIVTDSNGCVDSASIFITNTGITCIQIGGVFTPNGDGTNDTWEIPGIENYPDATVEIFNRWGQQIFYSNGYNSPWNGTYNNERLPTGDYFYIIDLGDGNPLKGALTIKN